MDRKASHPDLSQLTEVVHVFSAPLSLGIPSRTITPDRADSVSVPTRSDPEPMESGPTTRKSEFNCEESKRGHSKISDAPVRYCKGISFEESVSLFNKSPKEVAAAKRSKSDPMESEQNESVKIEIGGEDAIKPLLMRSERDVEEGRCHHEHAYLRSSLIGDSDSELDEVFRANEIAEEPNLCFQAVCIGIVVLILLFGPVVVLLMSGVLLKMQQDSLENDNA